jgi:hypothetical protein
MTTENMEKIIEEADKRGWRISNLSSVGAAHQYSCILERKKVGGDGFPVYALGDLAPTPLAALQSAWGHALQPVGNPRVDARRSAKPATIPAATALAEYLDRNVGCRILLEDALESLRRAHTGEADESDFL